MFQLFVSDHLQKAKTKMVCMPNRLTVCLFFMAVWLTLSFSLYVCVRSAYNCFYIYVYVNVCIYVCDRISVGFVNCLHLFKFVFVFAWLCVGLFKCVVCESVLFIQLLCMIFYEFGRSLLLFVFFFNFSFLFVCYFPRKCMSM